MNSHGQHEVGAPAQHTFLITLLDIDLGKAKLSFLNGAEVLVYFLQRDRVYGRAYSSEQTSCNHNAMEAPRVYSQHITIKQLGVAARKAAGLPGRTPLEVSVRVVWKG